jgi:hypothetical protein
MVAMAGWLRGWRCQATGSPRWWRKAAEGADTRSDEAIAGVVGDPGALVKFEGVVAEPDSGQW